MKIDFIDLKSQYQLIREDVERRIQTVLSHGQYIMGPEIGEVEERLAAYVGVRNCIAVSSGTDALLIALMALGVKPADEVITTPFTFIATAEAISLLGARPVFVDIDAKTYNLNPSLLEAAIGPTTRAIMPVSLFGQCADLDKINAIAARHDIPVIEDGAQSFGATYKGKRSCGLSTIGAASFFPSKPLGCFGDAGALFTDDDLLAQTMREIRVHGQERRYHHARLGVNGRMDTLQAAVILAKLEIFDQEVGARRQIGERYNSLLSNPTLPAGLIDIPYVEPGSTSVYAQYTIRVSQRNEVAELLRIQGIPTAVHYPTPLHRQPAFANLKIAENSFPISDSSAQSVLSLPMHPYLNETTQRRIAHAVIEAASSFLDAPVSYANAIR